MIYKVNQKSFLKKSLKKTDLYSEGLVTKSLNFRRKEVRK